MLPKVFSIMPFDEDFLDLFDELKSHFEKNYSFINAGDMDNPRSIIKDIVVGISSADVIVADLTGNNPNVFYELGLAHAMNKKVIIITQSIDELPFDIKSYRVLQYSLKFNKIPEFENKMEKLLNGAIDGSVAYGNPVCDYLPDYFQPNIVDKQVIDEPVQIPETKPSEDDGDPGFLDHISNIDNKYLSISTEVESISTDMKYVSNSISDATSEINRVKTQSASVDISFIRKVCKRLSAPISDFSDKFDKHIIKISNEWSTVENSYLLLLDNKLFIASQGKASLNDHKKSLVALKDAVTSSGEQMEFFINEINQYQGYERTLNKAFVLLTYSLDSYLQMTNQMSASIERIIGKINIALEE